MKGDVKLSSGLLHEKRQSSYFVCSSMQITGRYTTAACVILSRHVNMTVILPIFFVERERISKNQSAKHISHGL